MCKVDDRWYTFAVETTTGRFGSNDQVAGSTKVFVDEGTSDVTVLTVAFPGMEVEQPTLAAVQKAANRVMMQRARSRVLENVDLVALILSHTTLDPKAFVWAGRVSRTWRAACRVDASLLLRAANNPSFLTKGVFQGLFGLTSAEADRFPHGKRAHRQGFMFMYSKATIESVLPTIGGMKGWEERMAERATPQRWVSRENVKRQRLDCCVS